MQVNSINNSQQSFKSRNVILNPSVLGKSEKAAVKPLLNMVDSLSMVEEDVLRSFMARVSDAEKRICYKMINNAKSPVQEAFNRSMDVRI